MELLKEKINKLTDAIASPATPEGQKALFKNTLDKLEAQYRAEMATIETAEGILNNLLGVIEPIYAITSNGGYATIKLKSISSDGLTITAEVEGESPIVDSNDEKAIKKSVLELNDNGNDYDVEYNAEIYNLTCKEAKVQIGGNEVTGNIVFELNNSIR